MIASDTSPNAKPMAPGEPEAGQMGPRNSSSPVASTKERKMSKETPKDNSREASDEKSMKQTDKPWKGPVEKEQKRTGPPSDLEKWQRSDTH